MNAIAQAVETFDPPAVSLSSSYRKDVSNDSTGSFSVFRAPSISSLETRPTNVSSGSLGSYNSAYSHGSRHSLGSLNSLKSKERRRRRRIPTRAPKTSPGEGPRIFQCTFCTDTFKSKYDWYVCSYILVLIGRFWLLQCSGSVHFSLFSVFIPDLNASVAKVGFNSYRSRSIPGLGYRLPVRIP
jgi:hypothetical protein